MKKLLYISAIITIIKTIVPLINYLKKAIYLKDIKIFLKKLINPVLIASVGVQCIGYCFLAVLYGILVYKKYDLNIALFVASLLIIPSFYFFYKTIKLVK